MNLSPTTLTTIIVFIINIVVSIVWGRGLNQEGNMIGMGLAIIFQTLLFSTISIILLLIKSLRPIGQGILIGLGINLVVGFSVCTLVH